ncbi:MAG TPA: R3H domain-containing nucleic acid-binding protein [Anaerolineae bacterium]|nr:R3H domain-containing nucleic acid-binding protein [Anaerolineae bacterium]
MPQLRITDDLHVLLDVLPQAIADAVRQANRTNELLEIVMDLGRCPEARFVDTEVELSVNEVTQADIDGVVSRIGDFDADNRAGIERTLHRISGIRNRRGYVVGLTCRVGRAVYGTIDILEDILRTSKSILMLGRPGVGKTTMLREMARVLAEGKPSDQVPNRRVIIVDTSNEIGGDGDIPHPAVGRGRRMQVPTPSHQHEVMIEAVENHNPEVIVIDEIGRELEAAAARTIAERGVQLIGTAHGNTLENILLNPTLSDLVGGIESVTLSDEEARRRGTQKTVLERRAPATFDILVEIQERDRLLVHHDVAASVDALLRGRPLQAELRVRNADGEIQKEWVSLTGAAARERESAERPRRGRAPVPQPEPALAPATNELAMSAPRERSPRSPVRVYAYGVARNRIEETAKRLKVPAELTNDAGEADVILTVKNYYRKRPRLITDAERRGTPLYVLRANTTTQIENVLAEIFGLSLEDADPYSSAMRETQDAIQKVFSGIRSIDLAPQSADVRRMQHELIRQANLISHSYGREPYRRVRIYRE